MSEKDILENPAQQITQMTDEFRERFGRLSSRLHMIQVTQGSKLDELQGKIAGNEDVKDLSDENLRFLASLYLLLVTEEMYLVPIEIFQKDFLIYCRLAKAEFGKEDFQTEEFVEGVFVPFAQMLLVASQTIFEMTRWTIVRAASGWDPKLVESYVLNDFLKIMIQEMLNLAPQELDVRIVAAIGLAMAKDFIDRRKRLLEGNALGNISIYENYGKIVDSYPLEKTKEGDLAFDLAWKIVFQMVWDQLMEMLSPEIDALRTKLEEGQAQMKRHYEAEKKKKSSAYSDDYYLGLIGMKIHEVFNLGGDIDEKRETSLSHAIDVMLRRYAIDRTGKIGGDRDMILKMTLDLLWKLSFEYPQIVVPILEAGQLMAAFNSPDASNWLREHEDEVLIRFRSRLMRGVGLTPSYAAIAKSFIDLLKEASKARSKIILE
ncbi:MAG: hypothetical protein ACXACI_00650 [Candidatus Hodarchaeales archaeon]|jgi:hypothetical protein